MVVKCKSVDDNGVWGSLPDWGSSHTAYLPIGSVVRQRGRGQRKEQAAFLTRARRLVAKGQPHIFMAEVESTEDVSSSGINQIDETGAQIDHTFHVTVTRRGVTEEEETEAMETSKRLQRCASLIVDKAANQVGVPRMWARRVAMYEPYHRSLRSDDYIEDDDEREEESLTIPPSKAALHFLLEVIGKLPGSAKEEVLELLSPVDDKKMIGDEVDTNKRLAFSRELLTLCRQERKRLEKPVTYSLTGTIGDAKAIAALLKKGLNAEQTCDVAAVKYSLDSVGLIQPPEGCSDLTIAVRGAGSYTFSVRCSKDQSDVALSFLETAVTQANRCWASTVASDNESRPCTTVAITDYSTKQEGISEAEVAVRDLQPSLNIGLIGDVANGKSTMIHAMSGKRTQAHSSEHQKHGMTIRLGFANTTILRCRDYETCGSYSFKPDDASDSDRLICIQCGGPAEVAKRLSFIDCPGHAELMATMLSGASAFDAVIFAAAANSLCPSPQAKQHLEALRLSRSLTQPGRIAVAQTKAELVAHAADKNPSGLPAEELLALHADNAKVALRHTVASDAPFFPVCAPLGLGMEPLARWLADLPSRDRSTDGSAHHLFSVLRSFDVNRPGTRYNDLVGGVLGGTVMGPGAFHPGDLLEVRPGLVIGMNAGEKSIDKGDCCSEPTFSVHPLQCRCVELMTGKTTLLSATSGGLVAFRTTLSPSLCADDRLVGSVVGLKDRMPPVWGPTLFLESLTLVDEDRLVPNCNCPADRLKKGVKIRCHSGSAAVSGQVVRVSVKRGKLEVDLKTPLCAYEGSNVAIEVGVTGRSGFCLIAHATIFGGSCSYDGAKTPGIAEASEKNVSDIATLTEDDEERRVRFLEELAVKHTTDDGARIAVPKPQLTRDGGAHMVIDNFAVIAACLNREPAHLQAYLEQEGGLSCARAGSNGSCLRIRWRSRGGFPELFSKILRRYASTFVTCEQCRSAKTELLKAPARSNKTELLCRQCNARRFVTKL